MTYAIEFYTEIAGTRTKFGCAVSGFRSVEAAVKAAVDYLRQTRYAFMSATVVEEGLWPMRVREVRL
jgi:hypothetical protein